MAVMPVERLLEDEEGRDPIASQRYTARPCPVRSIEAGGMWTIAQPMPSGLAAR